MGKIDWEEIRWAAVMLVLFSSIFGFILLYYHMITFPW